MWAEAPDSLVTVTFSDTADGTAVDIVHGDFADEGEGAPYQMGWEAGLGKLERLFASPRDPAGST